MVAELRKYHRKGNNKFHAKPVYRNIDGKTVRFASILESNRYDELRLLERAHQIRNLRRQVRYVLIPAQRDSKGKLLERQAVYTADFVYVDSHGREIVEDTKSPPTRKEKDYILRRKLMLWVHGIRIHEI